MKANELQIGDWVQNPHGWKARVMSIKHTCVFKDEWEYLFKIGISKDTFQNNLSESDLSPIPLTPEILEKNGFYYDEDRKAYLMGVIFRVKPQKYSLFSLEICGCPYPLNSVHQLQQALRLCGIEKEIEL